MSLRHSEPELLRQIVSSCLLGTQELKKESRHLRIDFLFQCSLLAGRAWLLGTWGTVFSCSYLGTGAVGSRGRLMLWQGSRGRWCVKLRLFIGWWGCAPPEWGQATGIPAPSRVLAICQSVLSVHPSFHPSMIHLTYWGLTMSWTQ